MASTKMSVPLSLAKLSVPNESSRCVKFVVASIACSALLISAFAALSAKAWISFFRFFSS